MATITIDGVDKTSLVDWQSVKREQVLSKESDKLSFLIRKHNGQTYKPTAGNEVVFTTGTDQTLMDFDGVNDAVSATAIDNAYTGDFTISLTMTTPTPTKQYMMLATNSLGGAGTSAFELRMDNTTGTLELAISIGGSIYGTTIGNAVLSADTEYRITGRRSGSEISVWIDGIKDGFTTQAGARYSGTTFWIGRRQNSTNPHYFIGNIWDVRYWNTALSDADCLLDGTGGTASVTPTAYLQGYGNTDADWEDQIGSSDGTVVGSPTTDVISIPTTEFGGYIVEIQEDVDARVEYIKCICKDYTHDLDRQLVSKTYEAMTVDAIIADLIGTFATGITDNNVNCPVTLDSVTFNYLPISRCLTRLTELVDGFEWYIDYDKDIHFFETALVASAFDLTDTSGNYAYNSLSIREDTHQLRNEVIIRGGLLTSTTLRNEYLSGDGTKDVFPLATKFANLPTVTISAASKTVGVENIDGPGFDCYWNYNEKSLKFVTPPVAGTSNITVTQYPQYPLILQKRNETSITTYGVFQHVIVDKNIRDLDTAGLRADVELLRHSIPEKTANFLTYTSGLMTGQTINVQSTIRGINEDFKIQSIRSYLRTPNTDELTHEVECVTAEDLGINDILARLLVTNASDQIEIQEGEFIERIRQLTESLTITDSTPTATEVTGPFLYGTATMGFSTWA